MKFFATGVGGQLGHDVMNELLKRGYIGIGSDIQKMYPCYYPTNRSIKALIKNTIIAWKVLHKEKPNLIISSGAAVAVPFLYRKRACI